MQTAEPYISHTWRWRDHNITYAVRFFFFFFFFFFRACARLLASRGPDFTWVSTLSTYRSHAHTERIQGPCYG